jgi:hypothetical protein
VVRQNKWLLMFCLGGLYKENQSQSPMQTSCDAKKKIISEGECFDCFHLYMFWKFCFGGNGGKIIRGDAARLPWKIGTPPPCPLSQLCNISELSIYLEHELESRKWSQLRFNRTQTIEKGLELASYGSSIWFSLLSNHQTDVTTFDQFLMLILFGFILLFWLELDPKGWG